MVRYSVKIKHYSILLTTEMDLMYMHHLHLREVLGVHNVAFEMKGEKFPREDLLLHLRRQNRGLLSHEFYKSHKRFKL